MPPVIVASHDEEWVTKSIFEQMTNSGIQSTRLETTYRMNEAINAFPSYAFYDGHLVTASENRSRMLRVSLPQQSVIGRLLSPDKPEVFAIVPHKGKGMRSPEEAVLIANLIREAIIYGMKVDEIAVVSPYRAQVRLIREATKKAINIDDEVLDKMIDTVEKMQGQEANLVIISLVTSDPSHAAKRAAFYFMPNRLNVAITRAKCKRIVIGSHLLFQAQPENPLHRKWVDLYRSFFDSSTQVIVNPDDIRRLAPSNGGG